MPIAAVEIIFGTKKATLKKFLPLLIFVSRYASKIEQGTCISRHNTVAVNVCMTASWNILSVVKSCI